MVFSLAAAVTIFGVRPARAKMTTVADARWI
jgi:hypothetical protein